MKLIKLLFRQFFFKRSYKLRKLTTFLVINILSLTIILNLSSVNAQVIPNDSPQNILDENMSKMEQRLEKEYEDYFQRNIVDSKKNSSEIAGILAKLDQKTGTNSAVIWVTPEENYLHLVYLTKTGKIIVKDIKDAPFKKVTEIVKDFYTEINEINNPINLTQAQQLYQWIIKPYEAEFLEKENINNLLFCLENGVRLLPLVALHDGNNFLIQKYNITRIPAFNLINTEYESLKNPQILAMGASNFRDQEPLPAVTLELENIVKRLQNNSNTSSSNSSEILLNEKFTLDNMERQLKKYSFNIIHLATHANFNQGNPNNSYIQFWDEKLTLGKMANFPWQTFPDLLVLSACNTAFGDRNAELGFTGIALQSGVKSALGSLWSVSDLGTFALITEFYEQLTNPSAQNVTKTQALRAAQNLLLEEKIFFQDNSLITPHGNIQLPDSFGLKGKITLSHPFYWGGFTLISSPW